MFIIIGIAYYIFECFFRTINFDIKNYTDVFKYLSLIGYSSLWMIPIGGFLGMILGSLNTVNWINHHINIFWQSICGTVIILIVEFITGLILNCFFKLNLWDYSQKSFNMYGQICLWFGLIWLVFCPFIFWADDMLRLYLYKEGEYYSLFEIYKRFINPLDKPFI
jgi:uncharacterized membrane protein